MRQKTLPDLSCFKAYDIRGEIGETFNESIVYRISRATAQHLKAKSIVIGFDARETSAAFAVAAARGVSDSGADIIDIGMAGTEEMYWAVTQFDACAGIEITASHNPINYNGIKVVKSKSRPLNAATDFQPIKRLAESCAWLKIEKPGSIKNCSEEARIAYVNRVLSFVNLGTLKPLKIVINSGNGAAGPTFDVIARKLAEKNVPLEFVRVHHTPDHAFPHGIPNPLLIKNHAATAEVVKDAGSDFGVAFDGDFDRCFFFDERGTFVPGEYVVGLLASVFLNKEAGAKIVHDPRVIWNTLDIVNSMGGEAVQSKTGHAFIKQTMRSHQAIYGGEMSAHHYFRDFACCDSGMIPWLLVAELISKSGRSLGGWVQDRFKAFPSTGETNFSVKDPSAAIARVVAAYREASVTLDEIDGVSLAFEDWRFNLRCSNTEPLVRLNIESRGGVELIKSKLSQISAVLEESNS